MFRNVTFAIILLNINWISDKPHHSLYIQFFFNIKTCVIRILMQSIFCNSCRLIVSTQLAAFSSFCVMFGKLQILVEGELRRRY